MTEVLATGAPGLVDEAVRRAAALLREGDVVVLPTETVYGLAASAWDGAAVQRVFAAKGRPSTNPLIVHVADEAMARLCVREWPDSASRLAAAFWPGPLTLVLPRSPRIPDEVTAGGDTVGIRLPAHPVMIAVIRACGFPLAAPSANVSNAVSPTTAAHAAASLAGRVPLVVDGGPCAVGIESTVVDLTVDPPRVLRPGMIDEDAIAAVLDVHAPAGRAPGPEAPAAGPLRSPGQLARHYSPAARLVVLSWTDDADLGRQMAEAGIDRAGAHVLAWNRVPVSLDGVRVHVLPRDPAACARDLYAQWHRCDELGATAIVVERVPDAPPWRAIADRIARAATPA